MLRHFLENGVHIGDRGLSSGDWGPNRRMGSIYFGKQENGVQMQRSEDRLRRENFGVQENEKKSREKFRGSRKRKKRRESDNPEWMCGVQTMVIPELPFILVSRSTFQEFVSSPMLTGVVNYYPIRVQIVRLFLVFNHSSS